MASLRSFLRCLPPHHDSIRVPKVRFGCSLDDVCGHVKALPQPLVEIIVYICREGIRTVDVFRRPGNPNDTRLLIKRLSDGRCIALTEYNFFTLASVVKQFLLKMPGGLFGSIDEEMRFVETLEIEMQNKRLDELHRLLGEQSRATQHLLVLLFGTWYRVALHAELNHMSPEGLSRSVAGSVFPACCGRPSLVNKAIAVCRILIEHFPCRQFFLEENMNYFRRTTGTHLTLQSREQLRKLSSKKRPASSVTRTPSGRSVQPRLESPIDSPVSLHRSAERRVPGNDETGSSDVISPLRSAPAPPLAETTPFSKPSGHTLPWWFRRRDKRNKSSPPESSSINRPQIVHLGPVDANMSTNMRANTDALPRYRQQSPPPSRTTHDNPPDADRLSAFSIEGDDMTPMRNVLEMSRNLKLPTESATLPRWQHQGYIDVGDAELMGSALSALEVGRYTWQFRKGSSRYRALWRWRVQVLANLERRVLLDRENCKQRSQSRFDTVKQRQLIRLQRRNQWFRDSRSPSVCSDCSHGVAVSPNCFTSVAASKTATEHGHEVEASCSSLPAGCQPHQTPLWWPLCSRCTRPCFPHTQGLAGGSDTTIGRQPVHYLSDTRISNESAFGRVKATPRDLSGSRSLQGYYGLGCTSNAERPSPVMAKPANSRRNPRCCCGQRLCTEEQPCQFASDDCAVSTGTVLTEDSSLRDTTAASEPTQLVAGGSAVVGPSIDLSVGTGSPDNCASPDHRVPSSSSRSSRKDSASLGLTGPADHSLHVDLVVSEPAQSSSKSIVSLIRRGSSRRNKEKNRADSSSNSEDSSRRKAKDKPVSRITKLLQAATLVHNNGNDGLDVSAEPSTTSGVLLPSVSTGEPISVAEVAAGTEPHAQPSSTAVASGSSAVESRQSMTGALGLEEMSPSEKTSRYLNDSRNF